MFKILWVFNKIFIINKNIYVQGNTQATFWIDKKIFYLFDRICLSGDFINIKEELTLTFGKLQSFIWNLKKI